MENCSCTSGTSELNPVVIPYDVASFHATGKTVGFSMVRGPGIMPKRLWGKKPWELVCWELKREKYISENRDATVYAGHCPTFKIESFRALNCSSVYLLSPGRVGRDGMSESSLSDVTPSDGVLEQALRRAVQLAHKRGDLEAITVKRMRKAAEEDLNLQEGFFKQDPTWESKSKRIIIAEAVNILCCIRLILTG